ncbi:uncharacterized protein LOC117794330 isoform X2 [Drosophila innubila]|uniref:uncharacterized protein LOC117794330 isoform X2 n=1 Tax=Drosophila innubila TaxID=198719 RepID=UPI00148BBC70|nr:uncharacterized protein LOC117794330 isoform X2 [Drosophila innubila]
MRILKYLDFKDELNLFEATKTDPINRWASVLDFIWKKEKKYTFWTKQYEIFDKNTELMRNFLSCISSTVEELTLWDATPGRLECWTEFEFPKMRSLRYSTIFCNSDEKTRLHGLHHLNPSSFERFDLYHFAQWRHLKKLDKSYCDDFGALKSAIENGSFQMLENLSILEEDLNDECFNMLINLPNLRTIVMLCGSDCVISLDRRIQMRAEDIEHIILEFFYLNGLDNVSKLINVRQLTFIDMREDMFVDQDLDELITSLPQLERLDFKNVGHFECENELWNIVADCPSLKIFRMLKKKLGKDFISSDRSLMENVLNKRSTHLSLYFQVPEEVENLIRLYFKHPKLNVSFEPLEFEEIGKDSLTFHYRKT